MADRWYDGIGTKSSSIYALIVCSVANFEQVYEPLVPDQVRIAGEGSQGRPGAAS